MDINALIVHALRVNPLAMFGLALNLVALLVYLGWHGSCRNQ